MARRSGLGQVIKAVARESARQDRLRKQAERERQRHLAYVQREEARMEREEERRERQAARDQIARMKDSEKRKAAAYLQDRKEGCEQATEDAKERLERLASVLRDTLDIDDTLAFDSLRVRERDPRLDIPRNLRNPSQPPDLGGFLGQVLPLGFLARMFPWKRRAHARALDLARARHADEYGAWTEEEAGRVAAIDGIKTEHARAVEALARKRIDRDAEVDAFRDDYLAGDPDAVVSYNSMVLERSVYPEGFPQNFSVAYVAASKQLVVEYELPGIDIVPTVIDYRYVKARDEVVEKARKPAEVKADYADLVAAVALRTLHEVFEADQGGHVEACCFNGYIHHVDPATGNDVRPHLVSVRTTKSQFEAINLARVDKATCLRNLGASVSRSPEEAQPVRPIVEFSMADARFIDQNDLLGSLSDAPNLMDLSPSAFETLVANAFGKMGLESKLTRSSRDGGVDCIAFDQRPILGGKVVIQAKRYRHTVGVSAVRDLYGTMMNEGANKGILVATSGYGPDAFAFAKDKPIELIDGGGLLFLLQEVGVEARIVFPSD